MLDRETENDRRVEAAQRAAREEGVLRLELRRVGAVLTAQEAEGAELRSLCDYLHDEVFHLRLQIAMRDLVDREAHSRSRAAEAERAARQHMLQQLYATRPAIVVPVQSEDL